MINSKTKDIILKVRDIAEEKKIVATFSLHYENSHLMRIGNNSVSLSTSEELTRLDINVTIGLKQGSHTEMGEIRSIEQVEKCLNIAYEKAKVSKENDYTPIEDEVEETSEENTQFDKNFEGLSPAFKADSYSKIFNEVGNDYNYSGSWSSGTTEQFIVTTKNNNSAYHIGTDQIFTIVLKHPKKSWEITVSQTGWKKDDFDLDSVIKELKMYVDYYEHLPSNKIEIKDYTVVLGPQALAELIQMAMFTGLWGRRYEEKQAWTSENSIGDKILGENITILDDPLNDNTFKIGFDMSGQKRIMRELVKNGNLSSLMYDSTTAAKFKKKKTGHDSRSYNFVLETGTGVECPIDAVKDYEEVLYIPALHYINLPNISKGIFTGSSRFNALLIRKGEVIGPIFSSRITDTFQNVFGNVEKISKLAVSVNISDTYARRAPTAFSVPNYVVCKGVKITDCAESF
ncbi:MAG: hypothetical protein GQ534_02045 [Candidatus Delongbacteria bacterium]|nr:hypothetical protein [Candidatus Delongbacteria bacterium]